MNDWKQRLTLVLEPILRDADPRPKISAYHNMPYAIFLYPPDDEFALRAEVAMLRTRLEQAGKRVTVISLATCLEMALEREGDASDEIKMAEKMTDTATMVNTFHKILSEYQPLDALVAEQIPGEADPLVDIVFITRAGALFPFYRTSSLLEQLKGKMEIPAVLFYPGEFDGAAGLRFMGVLDAEHNYRPKIF
ncbi:BREX protein BrxB domain-containing protein [Candidatus Halocynthiibacter alkanivorans]|uniref:BREX protein BrxB domain-containing protein n=1 Tax=Candidatus Halocynthiibacter alkanivorans TaxID=2267619 RepID=UPI000DF26AFC|nr:BREX protein BrxB domain-containing protein [Candidatus Halocynthiibacter alkanivorans]